MCHYSGILGSGDALVAQILTVLSIVLSIAFWAWVYRRYGVALRPYIVPLALWVIFGTLDIVITARGTISNPLMEGNPLAQFVFVNTGAVGPVVASVLWISLWSLIVFVINKKIKPGKPASPAPKTTKPVALARRVFSLPQFLSLAVFYSLAVGHMRGFSSWYAPLCGISETIYGLLPGVLERFVGICFAGAALAALHMAITSIWVYDNKLK